MKLGPPESEQPLTDDTVVIRLGLMRLQDLKASSQRSRTSQGFHALSFYGENGLAHDEVAALAEKPHPQMRRSRVGILRQAGFEIQRSGRFPHLTIVFGAEPTEEQLERLLAAFDEAEPNPHPVQ